MNSREERIAKVAKHSGTAPLRSMDLADGNVRVLGVVLSIDATKQEMTWQRIGYATRPPKVGEYRRFGQIEKGYPVPTMEVEDFRLAVWGSGEIGLDTWPVEAVYVNGYWHLQLTLKISPSVLDPNAIPSGCHQG